MSKTKLSSEPKIIFVVPDGMEFEIINPRSTITIGSKSFETSEVEVVTTKITDDEAIKLKKFKLKRVDIPLKLKEIKKNLAKKQKEDVSKKGAD